MDIIDSPSESRDADSAVENGPPDSGKESVPAAAANAFPIVGVGASAGGLEAFTQLIQSLPTDTGMAFVLVQHLSPDHESVLAEILGRATMMSVVEVTDGLRVEPDRIYVIPPNVEMALRAGALRLIARPKTRGAYTPIDAFLRSLAAEMGHDAIAVILSGTASDGAEGIREIKASGGIVLAQQPESAKYDGMPRSAAATGCVDFILPPKLIAEEIARIARHPYRAAQRLRETSGSPAAEPDLDRIFLLLWNDTGIDFSLYRRSMVRRRIARRMILHRLETPGEYAERLEGDETEILALCQDLLINVTAFFRDPQSFQTLRSSVFPGILAFSGAAAPIRIWVPGCSTGEEPYSLLISLLEFLKEKGAVRPLQMFATDVDEAALDKARVGSYPEGIAADVSSERLRRFFTKTATGWQIAKSLREMCVFARQNVARDPPFSRVDLISCRNLLIYLEPALQRKIIPVLHYALRPEGFLMLGPSETVGGFQELFLAVDRESRIYARKSSKARSSLDLSGRGPPPVRRSLPKEEGAAPGGGVDVTREAERAILQKYFPAGVIVNDRLDILQFHGSTSAYLEPAPGEASLNLLKMARGGLLLELRACLAKARKSEAPVRKAGIRIRHGGQFRPVDLDVIPFRVGSGAELHHAVLFQESAAHREGKGNPAGSKPEHDLEVDRLRTELADAQDSMKAVATEHEAATEELRALNEELQSGNEELQSVNEEMETAKEELQSTNEELTTVNEELQNRNGELTLLNDDLRNVLGGIGIPVVLLDANLRVRRFNPPASEMLDFKAAGDGLAGIGARLSAPELESVVREVIDTMETREMEVRGGDGHWYSLRARPYRTTDDRIDGALLSLVDIDDLKSGQRRLEESRDYAQSIVDTVHQPLLILSEGLRVVTANRSFYETFRLGPDRVEGNSLRALGGGPWDGARLPELLESVLREGAVVTDFQVDREFPALGRRIFLLNARRLLRREGAERLILLAFEDVTDRRIAEEERGEALDALQEALGRVKRLNGLLPICSRCKKIRDDTGYWKHLESYISEHSEAEFSHGLCPDCARILYPDFPPDEAKKR